MRYFLSFMIGMGIGSSLLAQDSILVAEPNFIPVVTYWNLNDTFSYTVMKTDVQFTEDGIVKDSTGNQYNLKLTVKDSTDSIYVIEVLRSFDWNELGLTMKQLRLTNKDMDSIDEILNSEHLEYVISQVGIYKETRNLKNISKAVEYMLKNYLETDTISDASKAQVQSIFDKLSTPEYVNAKIMDVIILMHKFYGLRLAQDSIWEFDQKAQNPFAPDQVMNYHNRVLTTIPEDWGGLVRLQNYVSINASDFIGMVKGLFSGINITSKQKEEMVESYPTVEIYISYAIDKDLGKVESMYMEKSIYFKDKLARLQTIWMESVDE
jgi:hypothetical protein